MDVKRSKLFFPLLIAALLLAGCRTAKQSVPTEPLSGILPIEMQEMDAFKPVGNALSAKVKMNAEILGGKVSTSGNMKIEHGCGMSIGVTALGLFEIARLEASPADLQFLNKVTKECTSVTYSEVGFLQATGLNYNMLEAMFMNEIFSPEENVPVEKALSNMTVTLVDNQFHLTTAEKDGMVYKFYVDRNSGELVRTDGIYNNTITVACNYSDFRELNGRSFPHKINVNVDGLEDNVAVEFNLSNVKNDNYTFVKSNIASFTEIDIESLLESLEK